MPSGIGGKTWGLVDPAGIEMTEDNATCFITGVQGRLGGQADWMGVEVSSEGKWLAKIRTNSSSSNTDYQLRVGCIGAKMSERGILYDNDSDATWSSQEVLFNPKGSALTFTRNCSE